jgi:hypothetical protein
VATSGELSEVVADSFCLPKATAANCYRDLRENGMVPIAGRGPNSSAPVTPLTAAKLLIGMAGARYDREPAHKIVREFDSVVSTEAEYRAYFMKDGAETDARFRLDGLSLGALGNLPSGHTFLDGLAALIDASVAGCLPFKPSGLANHLNLVRIDVDIVSAPRRSASIWISYRREHSSDMTNCRVDYGEPRKNYSSREEMVLDISKCDFTITRKFMQKTIINIADLIRGAPLSNG